MRALAYPLAVLLVAIACFGAVVLAAGAATWGRWVLRIGGTAGVAGLVVAAGAAANLFVPRTCAEAETAVGSSTARNRPAFSVVVDDGDCFRSGLAQVQVVVLVVVATSAVVVVRSGARR